MEGTALLHGSLDQVKNNQRLGAPRLSRAMLAASIALSTIGISAFFSRGQGVATLFDANDGTYESYVELLNATNGEIYFTDVEYAQCYTGFCTKNGDGQTASCGCLSMRPSVSNEAKLEMGWDSVVMVGSKIYREAAVLLNKGRDTEAKALLTEAIRAKSLYDDYDLAAGQVSRVSLFSSSNEYWSVTDETETCHDFSFAQCMGAPCFDKAYESGGSVFNITCICPYQNASSGMYTKSFSGLCEAAREDGACAAVGYGLTTGYDEEYTAAELSVLLAALSSAEVTVDAEECPSVADR